MCAIEDDRENEELAETSHCLSYSRAIEILQGRPRGGITSRHISFRPSDSVTEHKRLAISCSPCEPKQLVVTGSRLGKIPSSWHMTHSLKFEDGIIAVALRLCEPPSAYLYMQSDNFHVG